MLQKKYFSWILLCENTRHSWKSLNRYHCLLIIIINKPRKVVSARSSNKQGVRSQTLESYLFARCVFVIRVYHKPCVLYRIPLKSRNLICSIFWNIFALLNFWKWLRCVSGQWCCFLTLNCLFSPGLCGHGVCQNTNGDFKCVCDEGYEPSPSMKICQGNICQNEMFTL